jgi:hypothetical protein
MSQIHDVAGYTDSAADYRAYMERLKANREVERDENARRRTRKRAFDAAVDSQEEEEEGDGSLEQENQEPKGFVFREEETAPDDESDDGSHVRYA